jgi:hypothetical protein
MFEIPSFSVKLGAKRMFRLGALTDDAFMFMLLVLWTHPLFYVARISWLLLVSLLSGSALSAVCSLLVGASLHPSRLIGVRMK